MGVNKTHYIIFGFKVHPNKLKSEKIDIWSDKFLPYIEGHRIFPIPLYMTECAENTLSLGN
jgi:hypothetical protein